MLPMAFTAALLLAQPPTGAAPAPDSNDGSTPPPSSSSSPSPSPSPSATATPEKTHAAPPSKAPTYDDLLQRIEALETAGAERSPPPSPRSTAATFVQNRFNPDLSMIADFAAAGTNLSDAKAETLTVPGFIAQSDRAGKLRGIDFNYLELAFAAAVDPYFDFFSVVTFAPSGFDIEETYVDTRQLPFGFQLRIGKFLSAFGRLNIMHQHAWDFYDQPLVYEAFMGLEGWKNPGARLSWTAPVDFLVQLDLEVFQGVNDESPVYNATAYEVTTQNGTTLSSKAPFVPGLYVGSLKTSFDVGDSVFLAGASVMYGHSTRTRVDHLPTDMAFSAPGTILYNGELTYKYLLSSYRSITWQSEYLGLLSSGDLALAVDGLVHSADKKQGGFYSQLVWRFDEPGRWRVGARFDLLDQNSSTVDGVAQALDNMLARYTTMLTYSPTEFSRFRLQYAYDRSRFLAGARKDVHEVLLEMNIAIGPHGAHSF